MNKSASDSERLTAALAALRSDDVLIQNEGVVDAIQLGPIVIPGLLSLLTERGVNRAQVMYALAEIGDVRAEQAFLAGLGDRNELVRAYAAQGLVRIAHPEAVAACLQTLNDAADELHNDVTPSVQALGALGLHAAPPLLDLLMADDLMTRLHAQRALGLILARQRGFQHGQGFPDRSAAEQAQVDWRERGNYDYTADATTRAASVAQLRAWFGALIE